MTNDELVKELIEAKKEHAKDLKDFAEKFAWLSTQLLLGKQEETFNIESILEKQRIEEEHDPTMTAGILDNVG